MVRANPAALAAGASDLAAAAAGSITPHQEAIYKAVGTPERRETVTRLVHALAALSCEHAPNGPATPLAPPKPGAKQPRGGAAGKQLAPQPAAPAGSAWAGAGGRWRVVASALPDAPEAEALVLILRRLRTVEARVMATALRALSALCTGRARAPKALRAAADELAAAMHAARTHFDACCGAAAAAGRVRLPGGGADSGAAVAAAAEEFLRGSASIMWRVFGDAAYVLALLDCPGSAPQLQLTLPSMASDMRILSDLRRAAHAQEGAALLDAIDRLRAAPPPAAAAGAVAGSAGGGGVEGCREGGCKGGPRGRSRGGSESGGGGGSSCASSEGGGGAGSSSGDASCGSSECGGSESCASELAHA